MENKIIANTIPLRSTRGPQVMEAAVLEGLQKRAGCMASIFENPESYDITVEIESPEGFWSRKFSPKASLREVEPAFIRRAVEEAIFTDRGH